MSTHAKLARGTLLALALLGAGAVRAQTAATFDMALPADSAATCRGPLCLAWNPAGLAWNGELEIAFLHQERWAQKMQVAGRADGLFVSCPWAAAGFQYVRPNALDESRDYFKLDLAVDLIHLWDMASLAVGLSVLDPTETAAEAEVDWYVGLMLRPWRYVSIGLVGRDLAEARMGERRSSRSMDVSLAVRPLWFAQEALTLAVDWRVQSALSDPQLRFTVLGRVWEGVELFASADLTGAFGFGLAVDLPHLGVSGYTRFGGEEDLVNEGLIVGARASLEPRPGLALFHGRTAEVVLSSAQVDADQRKGFLRSRPTLYEAEQALRQAAEDETVDSVLVRVEDAEPSLTRVQELREACHAVRAAGKKIAFFLETATNASYYLASAGDAIYLSPGGVWSVAGPQISALFFGGTLTLVGGRAEATQAGRYKSAPEMFTREEPSPDQREVMTSLSEELADQMLAAIAVGRGMERARVDELVNRGLLTAQEALDADLVDCVLHRDELEGELTRLLGHAPRMLPGYGQERWIRDRWGIPTTIAVVHAAGSINYGERTLLRGMDVRALRETLRKVAEDPGVAAVVLRIDSPGGSGLASELLHAELVRLRKQKPLIVSMAGVAASGGYYIAAPAHAIVANPATLTGSIGVFSLLFDLSELYARLGISQEVVAHGASADLFSTFRGRTPEELARLQATVDAFYATFVDRVAEGRGLQPEQVREVAQGRVWTGRQAKERGLVDELGGLSQALALARARLDLPEEADVRVVHLPRKKLSLGGLVGEVIGLGLGSAEQELLPAGIQEALEQLAVLSALSQEPVLALLPWFALRVR